MKTLNNDEIRQKVSDIYAKTVEGCCGGPSVDDASACCVTDAEAKATDESGCGCGTASSSGDNNEESACCNSPDLSPNETSETMGYSQSQLASLPKGANLGLGCGNPQAIASIKPGETVLDLGSGAGIDCFLAANTTGKNGNVIGVDMTPQMISKAKSNAEKSNLKNVEFRLGEIENLPVADNNVDVIISNCVINLSPEKQRVYKEMFRVLKPGGRIAVSDIVLTTELPKEKQEDIFFYTGCMAGASALTDIEIFLLEAGFSDIHIIPKDESREFIRDWVPGSEIEDYVVSATIQAVKLEV